MLAVGGLHPTCHSAPHSSLHMGSETQATVEMELARRSWGAGVGCHFLRACFGEQGGGGVMKSVFGGQNDPEALGYS